MGFYLPFFSSRCPASGEAYHPVYRCIIDKLIKPRMTGIGLLVTVALCFNLGTSRD